jgi:hypothetical protein
VVDEGCKARALEKEAEEKEEAEKQQAEIQKANNKVQKAQAAEETKKRVQMQAQVAFEGKKLVFKAKVEAFMGPGPLANMVFQAAINGNYSKAKSLMEEALTHSDKSEDQKKAFLSSFGEDLKQLAKLKKTAGKQEFPAVAPSVIETTETPVKEEPAVENQGEPTMADSTDQPQAGLGNPPPSGVLDKVKQAVKDNLHLGPGELTDVVMKDAKQAVNYEIRKGMRNLLKDTFKDAF